MHLSDEIIPPNEDDDTFVKALEELDARIDFGEEYGDWEADFFAMKDLCCARYFYWLQAKGVPETFVISSRPVSSLTSRSFTNTMPAVCSTSCLMPWKSFSWIG